MKLSQGLPSKKEGKERHGTNLLSLSVCPHLWWIKIQAHYSKLPDRVKGMRRSRNLLFLYLDRWRSTSMWPKKSIPVERGRSLNSGCLLVGLSRNNSVSSISRWLNSFVCPMSNRKNERQGARKRPPSDRFGTSIYMPQSRNVFHDCFYGKDFFGFDSGYDVVERRVLCLSTEL